VHIELDDLVTGAVTGVGDIDADRHLLICRHLLRIQAEVGIGEAGVTQAETEWEQRLRTHLDESPFQCDRPPDGLWL